MDEGATMYTLLLTRKLIWQTEIPQQQFTIVQMVEKKL